MFSVSGIRV